MENKDLELFASCLAGLEGRLAEELKRMGIRRVRPLTGGVAFFCDTHAVLRVCLWSRLASRVMLIVGRVSAVDADTLYAGVSALPWDEVLTTGARIAMNARGTNEELRNTHFTALKVKDAVCDRLCEAWGARPEVDVDDPDAIVDVRIHGEKGTVSLDLSGESLYRRSYLTDDEGGDAPLECAQAAGLLALAGWHDVACGKSFCVDPVCGGGSLVVEAASAACDAAPGLARDRWGFRGWALFDESAWNSLLDEADERFERGLIKSTASKTTDILGPATPSQPSVRFIGMSLSSPAIARARGHVKRAGLRQVVSIESAGAEQAASVVKRAVAAIGASTDGQRSGLIASVLSSHGSDRSDAQAQAEAAAFVNASSAAPRGSLFATVGDDVVESRFDVPPTVKTRLGRDRVEISARVFQTPPSESVVVTIPDSKGGPEHRVSVYEKNSEQFASRLRKRARECRKWAKREGVTCYRVYDADLPDYAVALDVYTGAGSADGVMYLHVAEYAAPSSIDPSKSQRRLDDVLILAPVVLGIRPDHVFSKVRQRDRGGGQYRDEGRRSYVTQVREDGYLLEVDLSGYLDTGLFLDHRLTRELIGTKAKGGRFLNLFAYTGTATVHAAGGGAVETVTVDLSQTYLDWARRNMATNGFDGVEHQFERGDAMAWITACRRTSRRFDLVFVDPPTFSNSKAMGSRTWDVQRDHVELLIGVSRLLAEGGEAVFSCNLRSFKIDVDTLAKYGVTVEDITPQTIPHDFERTPKIHSCFLVRRA